ncbi:hypothetical protein Nepgr_021650 [Nepenthes gracilis]|uniref:Uncharacterized protein n=1 Tax=Nepenthes gracilis TaxID=150966 RepID=A0AAD3SZ17_NEPGR|nr:hypothetical protein Nepgr_021650 [Nepenthes gracilis]
MDSIGLSPLLPWCLRSSAFYGPSWCRALESYLEFLEPPSMLVLLTVVAFWNGLEQGRTLVPSSFMEDERWIRSFPIALGLYVVAEFG